MGLGNTGNMQMEEANSKVQIVGTTYEYLDHIGEPPNEENGMETILGYHFWLNWVNHQYSVHFCFWDHY